MNILIIRSSSIQHLALVLKKLKTQFSGAKIDVLTHKHSMGSMKEVEGVHSVLPYPSVKDFSPFLLSNHVQKKYDLVVVPASNISGFGYENVFLLALRYKKNRVALCNYNGELILFPLKKILVRALQLFTYLPIGVFIAFLLTGINLFMIAVILIAIWFSVFLHRGVVVQREAKGEGKPKTKSL